MKSFSPPDFDNMTWKCPCCLQNRQSKYIKVMVHDVSTLFSLEVGTFVINCRYCVDMPICQEKAFNREWVIHKFLPFVEDKTKGEMK